MVTIANYNCPGQIVITGEEGAAQAAVVANFHLFIDLAHETGKSFAGSYLHKSIHAVCDHTLHRLLPFHGRQR